MQRTVVAQLGNKDLTFCQYESLDDAKKDNLPENMYYYWEYNGQRIFSPGEVISLVILHAKTDSFQAQSLLSQKSMQQYYNKLHEAQQTTILNQFKEMEKQVKEHGGPAPVQKAALESLRTNMQMYQNSPPKVGLDGVFKPTREQAIVLLGGEENLNKFLTPEQQQELFEG